VNPRLTRAPALITTRDRSQEATRRLEQLVPGGAHTYAKAAHQYLEGMAPVIARGDGATVWDVDGSRYLQLGSGLRSVALGHRHPRVNAAVRAALDLGATTFPDRAGSSSRRPSGCSRSSPRATW